MQIIVVSDFQKAMERAKEILYEKVDKKTVLFLSGGATPKSLYTGLAKDRIIHPAAVGMIDERYGEKWHEQSNELMIQETGLLDYLSSRNIPFYPILQGHPELDLGSLKKMPKHLSTSLKVKVRHDNLRQKTAEEYDKTTRDLFFHFRKSVAIMGIGVDGHISSIAPNRKDFTNPMFDETNKQVFVGEFNDIKSSYQERIGMTFAGLALIDFFIILAFGKEKKKALEQMFAPGPLEEIPARFFVQHAFKNSIILTDQQV